MWKFCCLWEIQGNSLEVLLSVIFTKDHVTEKAKKEFYFLCPYMARTSETFLRHRKNVVVVTEKTWGRNTVAFTDSSIKSDIRPAGRGLLTFKLNFFLKNLEACFIPPKLGTLSLIYHLICALFVSR